MSTGPPKILLKGRTLRTVPRHQHRVTIAVAPSISHCSHAVTVVAGAEARLTCALGGGTPRPSITWHRGRGRSAASSRGGELVVARAGPGDSGLYSCVAASSAGTAECSVRLVVIGEGSTSLQMQILTQLYQ